MRRKYEPGFPKNIFFKPKERRKLEIGQTALSLSSKIKRFSRTSELLHKQENDDYQHCGRIYASLSHKDFQFRKQMLLWLCRISRNGEHGLQIMFPVFHWDGMPFDFGAVLNNFDFTRKHLQLDRKSQVKLKHEKTKNWKPYYVWVNSFILSLQKTEHPFIFVHSNPSRPRVVIWKIPKRIFLVLIIIADALRLDTWQQFKIASRLKLF